MNNIIVLLFFMSGIGLLVFLKIIFQRSQALDFGNKNLKFTIFSNKITLILLAGRNASTLLRRRAEKCTLFIGQRKCFFKIF